jgi:hypothetical protein
LEQKVKPVVESFLSERGLELSQEKSKITHIDEGFDFLSVNIPITLENAKSAFSSDVKIRAKVNAGFENYQ